MLVSTPIFGPPWDIMLTNNSRRQLLAQLNKWGVRKLGSGRDQVCSASTSASAKISASSVSTINTSTASTFASEELERSPKAFHHSQDQQFSYSLASSGMYLSVAEDGHDPLINSSLTPEKQSSASQNTPLANTYLTTESECDMEMLNLGPLARSGDPAMWGSDTFNDAYFMDWTTLLDEQNPTPSLSS